GKGSVAAMTEAILRAAGLRTGLFTSPHLSRFTERIRIDGREVDGDHLAALDEAIVATGVPLTYFEISTVLAFLAFAKAGVQVMVLETGLGGRLDATTTCHPLATAVTSIGLDHTEFLGGTLAAIASEKAGIAKRGVPLFLGAVAPEARQAIERAAGAVGAPVRLLDRDLPAAPVSPRLNGPHQQANAALAVALAVTAFAALGCEREAARAIEQGLHEVVWPGRLEWLETNLLLDCAHNAEGAQSLATFLDGQPRRRRALVVSIVAGKASADILRILAPRFDVIVTTDSSNSRALAPEILASLVPSAGAVRPSIVAQPGPAKALEVARAAAGPDGVVVAAGSIFLIGDIRAHVRPDDGPRDPLPTSDPLPHPSTSR
ncbi:MAG TPA: bifunctional folylpolyglutamate synthase/dihydrofolate synthase, partial [Polyangia bacterium]|nr:bifunctional folylpolyglutamate synthase/dihydrofolate synthase [Polyangia bacterium]